MVGTVAIDLEALEIQLVDGIETGTINEAELDDIAMGSLRYDLLRLKEFDDIARRIDTEDLLASALFHDFVQERHALVPEVRDHELKVLHHQYEPGPASTRTGLGTV
jgi:hypothetical protein